MAWVAATTGPTVCWPVVTAAGDVNDDESEHENISKMQNRPATPVVDVVAVVAVVVGVVDASNASDRKATERQEPATGSSCQDLELRHQKPLPTAGWEHDRHSPMRRSPPTGKRLTSGRLVISIDSKRPDRSGHEQWRRTDTRRCHNERPESCHLADDLSLCCSSDEYFRGPDSCHSYSIQGYRDWTLFPHSSSHLRMF